MLEIAKFEYENESKNVKRVFELNFDSNSIIVEEKISKSKFAFKSYAELLRFSKSLNETIQEISRDGEEMMKKTGARDLIQIISAMNSVQGLEGLNERLEEELREQELNNILEQALKKYDEKSN